MINIGWAPEILIGAPFLPHNGKKTEFSKMPLLEDGSEMQQQFSRHAMNHELSLGPLCS